MVCLGVADEMWIAQSFCACDMSFVASLTRWNTLYEASRTLFGGKGKGLNIV